MMQDLASGVHATWLVPEPCPMVCVQRCACHMVSARTQHHIQNPVAPSPAHPWFSQNIKVAHPRCQSQLYLCLVLFPLSFLGRVFLAPIMSCPSVCALHLTKLWLLVQVLQSTLHWAGEVWGNGTGTADRRTPTSPVVPLPGWLCGTAEEVRKAVWKLVF